MTQTAVELLHKESNELITQYLDGKIKGRELLTMHHNILYPHKAMEKEQMRLIYEGLLQNIGTSVTQSDLPTFEEYYEKIYKN